MLEILTAHDWNETFSSPTQQEAMQRLESGHILYFPKLSFTLDKAETFFLSPDHADPHAKNISYHPETHHLWGVQRLTDEEHLQLKTMMQRFSRHAYYLLEKLFPHYLPHLQMGRTSFRPVEITNRKTSFRKDDKRLHVDAFPSAPNQGKRILRVFAHINPHDVDRVWRIGEPFATVAEKFLPRIPYPLPGKAALLRLLKITKSYRTAYDHYMLHLHDKMKADENYQRKASQQEICFAAGSTWIVQTDHVSHAAMRGQYTLEQTFYLPVKAMLDESNAPLRILEKMLDRRLV